MNRLSSLTYLCGDKEAAWSTGSIRTCGVPICRSSLPRTDCLFIHMHHVGAYERRLFIMTGRYACHLDSDDLDMLSLQSYISLCCMDRPSSYCWLNSFSSVWLKQLYFEDLPWQVYMDLSASFLLRWHNDEAFAIRLSNRSQLFVGVDAFDRRALHNYRFLFIPRTLLK